MKNIDKIYNTAKWKVCISSLYKIINIIGGLLFL